MTLSTELTHSKDGVLVFPADQSLGFHLLAALLRLGRNCKGLVSKKNPKKETPSVPLIEHSPLETPLSGWSLKEEDLGSAVFILEEELRTNQEPSENTFQRLYEFGEGLKNFHKDLHLIWVFPYNSPENQIKKFQGLGTQSTLFLSPPFFGFRDQGLMDLSLKNRSSDKELLGKNIAGELNVGLVSAPDLVGFVVSALRNATTYSKVIAIPEQVKELAVWIESFHKYFGQPSFGFIEKVANFFQRSPFEKFSVNAHSFPFPKDIVKATDIFPSPLQSLDRYMKSSFENLMRAPEHPMHFPSRRAL